MIRLKGSKNNSRLFISKNNNNNVTLAAKQAYLYFIRFRFIDKQIFVYSLALWPEIKINQIQNTQNHTSDLQSPMLSSWTNIKKAKFNEINLDLNIPDHFQQFTNMTKDPLCHIFMVCHCTAWYLVNTNQVNTVYCGLWWNVTCLGHTDSVIKLISC